MVADKTVERLIEKEPRGDPAADFWLIACIPDGEQIVYLSQSPDCSDRDILINGNWEDDGIILDREEDLAPGVYRLKLTVKGGRDTHDPYEHWMEIKAKSVECLWQVNQAEED